MSRGPLTALLSGLVSLALVTSCARGEHTVTGTEPVPTNAVPTNTVSTNTGQPRAVQPRAVASSAPSSSTREESAVPPAVVPDDPGDSASSAPTPATAAAATTAPPPAAAAGAPPPPPPPAAAGAPPPPAPPPTVPVRDLPPFTGSAHEISAELAARITGVSWHEGCPVPIGDLRHLRLDHVGFDGHRHRGELVVHADAAGPVLEAFRRMY